jgi:RimJ/RimL family protein N-acetyltransferase
LSERVFIRGQKVVLREKRIEDAPDDFAWRSDEELAKLDATRPLNMTYDDFMRYARTEIDDPGPRSKRLAIDTLDGRHIGNFMYYDLDLRRGEAELGIMIGDRDYWGKGYGSDAIRAVQDYIFTQTTLTRVYLHTLEWNERAKRSFAKAGMRDVKTVRRSGMKFVRMEMLRHEWETLREAEARDTLERAGVGPDLQDGKGPRS